MVYGKIAKGLPPLRIPKLSEKNKIGKMKNKKYMRLISGVMVENCNYIGTSLNGLIQEFITKGEKPIEFLQKYIYK